ncbi:unnamed protein product [Rotaria magnacalcarata]|nr:unnamed protein product [Rotaria magnacalcarata]
MYLVTCGFTRKMDHMNLDRFLVVYDLRNMQQLAPVPVFVDPCFLHYHTMTSTSVMVASQQGHHTQVDLTGGLTQPYSPIINLTTNPAGIISTFSVSTSMHCTAFGHSTGTIHLLYKNDPQCCFNYQSVETQFANPPMDPKVGDLNNSMSSLSSVPIPITPLKLLSDMPKQWTKPTAR